MEIEIPSWNFGEIELDIYPNDLEEICEMGSNASTRRSRAIRRVQNFFSTDRYLGPGSEHGFRIRRPRSNSPTKKLRRESFVAQLRMTNVLSQHEVSQSSRTGRQRARSFFTSLHFWKRNGRSAERRIRNRSRSLRRPKWQRTKGVPMVLDKYPYGSETHINELNSFFEESLEKNMAALESEDKDDGAEATMSGSGESVPFTSIDKQPVHEQPIDKESMDYESTADEPMEQESMKEDEAMEEEVNELPVLRKKSSQKILSKIDGKVHDASKPAAEEKSVSGYVSVGKGGSVKKLVEYYECLKRDAKGDADSQKKIGMREVAIKDKVQYFEERALKQQCYEKPADKVYWFSFNPRPTGSALLTRNRFSTEEIVGFSLLNERWGKEKE